MANTTKKMFFEILEGVSDPMIRSYQYEIPRPWFSHTRYVHIVLDFSDDWRALRDRLNPALGRLPLMEGGHSVILSTVRYDDRTKGWQTRVADRVFKYTKWLREYKSKKEEGK